MFAGIELNKGERWLFQEEERRHGGVVNDPLAEPSLFDYLTPQVGIVNNILFPELGDVNMELKYGLL